MKRVLFYVAIAATLGLGFASCGVGGEEFNEAFLYSGSGEWISQQTTGGVVHTYHDVFRADGTGTNWSEIDNVEMKFKWELSGSRLTLTHWQEMLNNGQGGWGFAQDYTVTTLTETKLVYESGLKTISCTKL